MEYYSGMKKNEILPFTTTWIDLQSIMLSEMSDRERQITYVTIYMWNLKKKTKHREQTSGYQKGRAKQR